MPADWTARAVLLVGVGAAIGGILRYFAGVYLSRDDWPWGTIAVNLAGSFLVGFIMFGAVARGYFGPDARTFLVTGVIGGFTTMSSFAYETAAFVDDAEFVRALAYASLTIVGSLAMVFLGRLVVQGFPGG